MGVINLLTVEVSDKIAAGEVVERPSSVVKELVENAIDAGANIISVEIENGGVTYIRVTDNGCGMSKEDAIICFNRHATSKIRTAKDIEKISTLGFRGEALSSICAVSEVEMTTKKENDSNGTYILYKYSKLISCEETVGANGTCVTVKNLFGNVPARLKFLKKDSTEAGYVSDIMTRFILANPHISFKFIKDGKEIYFTPGDNDITNAVYAVYGREYAKKSKVLEYEYNQIKVSGIIGLGETARANRAYQSFFINGRYIKNAMLTRAVEEAYKGRIMVGKFPVFALNITMDPANTDINVHPTKMEAKFSNEQDVYRSVFHAVENELSKNAYVPEVERETSFFQKTTAENFKKKYSKDNENTTFLTYKDLAKDNFKLKREIIEKPFGGLQIEMIEKDVEEVKTNPQATWNISSIEENYKTAIKEPREDAKETPTVVSEHITFTQEKPDFSNQIKIIGQLFRTYIIAQEGDSMLLVDQHAAHERVLYEKVKAQLREKTICPQVLMVPIPFDMSPQEADAYIEHKKEIDEMGFEIDIKKDKYYFVAVPEPMDEETMRDVFCEIVTAFIDSRQEIIDSAKDRLLKTIACRAAIKANRRTNDEEMMAIIKQVIELESINTCPHGRPIIIRMTKKEIEKEFGRTI